MSSRGRRWVIGLAAVLLLSLMPGARASQASVAVDSVNGQPVVNGSVGTVKGKTLTVAGSAQTAPPLHVDAGDSLVVKRGEPAQVRGLAYNGIQPYDFAWSHAGDSSRFDDPAEPATSFDTTDLTPGKHVLDLVVTDDRGRSAKDTVQLLVWDAAPRVLIDTRQSTFVGVPDELVTSEGLDGETYTYDFDVPAGMAQLQLELVWTMHEDAVVVGVNDYDLYVDDPSGTYSEDSQAATAAMPEIFVAPNPEPGGWKARVASFATVPEEYQLTAVANPAEPVGVLPAVSTPGPFHFEEGATQRLTSTVDGGAAPVDVRWDLDFDGVFETPGAEATAALPVGSHFVTVKATDAAGYEKREVTAVRVVAAGAPLPTNPLVVVAVADSGLNLYHRDFAATTYPDPRIRELTADFTRHPSEYIDGFPKATPALPITLGAPFAPDKPYPAQDEPLFDRKNLPLEQLVWVPGTKVIGAIDMDDGGAVNAAADVTPILDEDGHGTHSASVAVGNIYGFCPTCLLVFAEGLDASFFYAPEQSWIDITSNSYGSLANVGTPVVGTPDFPKENAERGQIALYAAGNGNENAFVTPEQTYTSNNLGPPWAIRVGAVDRATRDPFLGTGKPVDVASFGSGDIPAADHRTPTGLGSHSGTSAATPYTAGVFGTVLSKAREVLGDNGTGQYASPQGAIAKGKPLASSPYLKDGVLTRTELTEVVIKSAEHDATPYSPDEVLESIPPTIPPNPYQYLLEGYGVVDGLGIDREVTTDQKAIAVLLGAAPLPERAEEDEFFARDNALRTELWGTWAGGGDNSAATTSERALSPRPLRGTTLADVANIDSALDRLDRAYGPLQPAAVRTAVEHTGDPATTRLFLHGGACAQRTLTVANSTGDADACPLTSGTWTSSSGLARSVPAGSKVSGLVFVQAPKTGLLDLTATLSSGDARLGASRVRVPAGPTAARLFPAADGYLAVPIDFVTSAAIPVGVPIGLTLDVRGADGFVLGLEGAHASFVSITSTSPASSSSSGDGLHVAITAPAGGTVIDPGATPEVTVSGTSNLPMSPGGTLASRYFPRRSGGDAGCSADTFLSKVDETDELCGAINQVVPGMYVEDFPLRAGDLPLTLGAGRPAEGVLYMTGLFSPSAVEIVRIALTTGAGEARTVIASQDVTGSVITNPTFAVSTNVLPDYVEFPFSIEIPAEYVDRPLDTFSVELSIQASQGGTSWQLDSPSSYIDLPVPGSPTPAPGTRVEIGVDDPALSKHVLATIGGDGSWSGALDVSALSDGAHTIYVRAADDSSAVVTSVPVEVRWSSNRPPGRVEVQVTGATAAPRSDRWVVAKDVSGTGDFARWTYTQSLSSLRRGTYAIHTRVIREGEVVATGSKVTFKR